MSTHLESRICLLQQLVKLSPSALLGGEGGQHAHISASQRELLVSGHLVANYGYHAFVDQKGCVGACLFQGRHESTEDGNAVLVAVVVQAVLHEIDITILDGLLLKHVVFLEGDSLRQLVVGAQMRRREQVLNNKGQLREMLRTVS